MKHVPFEQWTVKSLASANEELSNLVKGFANDILRRRTEETEIIAVDMSKTNEPCVPLG